LELERLAIEIAAGRFTLVARCGRVPVRTEGLFPRWLLLVA
jgi:hypothetical protein